MMAQATERRGGWATAQRALRAALLSLALVCAGVLAAAAPAAATAPVVAAAAAPDHDCGHAAALKPAEPTSVGRDLLGGVACVAHCIAQLDADPALLAAAPSAPRKPPLAAPARALWMAEPPLGVAPETVIARAPPLDPSRPRLAAAIDPKTFRLRL